MNTWLLLHYKLPVHPSALRVYVWRKLRRLGAIFLNDTVWVLPDTPKTAEHFQWLVTEIQERKGDAVFWRANLVLGIREDTLIEQFKQQLEREYKELLKKLSKQNPDVSRLSQDYQQLMAKDYFQSEVGKQVKERLLALRGDIR